MTIRQWIEQAIEQWRPYGVHPNRILVGGLEALDPLLSELGHDGRAVPGTTTVLGLVVELAPDLGPGEMALATAARVLDRGVDVGCMLIRHPHESPRRVLVTAEDLTDAA